LSSLRTHLQPEPKLTSSPGVVTARINRQATKPVSRPALKFWVKSAAVASVSAMITLCSKVLGVFFPGEYRPKSNSQFVSSEAWVRQYRIWEEKRDLYLAEATERSCPLCGSWQARKLWNTADGYRYVACEACNMVYSSPALSDEQWSEFLKECRDVLDPINQKLVETRLSPLSLEGDEERFSEYLWRIGKHMKPGRVLDVGCLTGNFLGVAKRMGYECTGVEVYRDAAVAGAEFHGIPIIPGFLGQVVETLGREQFDLLTMWEVLEHVNLPAAELRRAYDLLAPGGLVAVTVPNFDNLHFRVLQDRCFHGMGGPGNPGHMNMFTTGTLKEMFAKNGFKVLTMFTETGTDFDELLAFLSLRLDVISSYENIFRARSEVTRSGEHYTFFSNSVMNLISKSAPFLRVWEAATGKGGLIFAIATKV